VVFLTYAALVPLLYFGLYQVAVVGFVALSMLQNYWQPILVSRFDAYAGEQEGATVLSIESQVRAVATMVIAPVFGVAVDFVRANGPGAEFWPVALIAAAIAALMLLTPLKTGDPHEGTPRCLVP